MRQQLDHVLIGKIEATVEGLAQVLPGEHKTSGQGTQAGRQAAHGILAAVPGPDAHSLGAQWRLPGGGEGRTSGRDPPGPLSVDKKVLLLKLPVLELRRGWSAARTP